MFSGIWLILSGLLYSLQLQTGNFPKPLTEQEERHYLELAAQGDLEARNILIERNLRLVAHIMKKYYAQTSDQEDLISIGTIGLIKGITTFDASKGARLGTYAARCVENAILTPTPEKAPHVGEALEPPARIPYASPPTKAPAFSQHPSRHPEAPAFAPWGRKGPEFPASPHLREPAQWLWPGLPARHRCPGERR